MVLALVPLFAFGLVLRLTAAPRPLPPLPKLPPQGSVAFEIRDDVTGELVPGKLTILGVKGTPDPQLSRGDVGNLGDGYVGAYNRVFSATGMGAFYLPLGSYDVVVSRGPEWTLHAFDNLHLDAAHPALELRARLRHVVDTAGWLSADFHVHAAPSPDSRVPMVDRVHEFLADGIDMIVATDHNVVSDYAPIIAELGVEKYLASATGDELTTNGWGHFGAFPLPQDLEGAGHGAVLVKGRNARDFFQDVRRIAPEAVIDVHHPRIDNEIAYFNMGHFDAQTDHADRPGFSFDFDALEVLNGYQDSERRSVDKVINDWFGLIDHGHQVTATGNSDTHHLTYNLGGYPRNYVKLDDDRPAKVDVRDVARAVKAHQAFFTTGPFVRLSSGTTSIGGLVPVKGGTAHAEIEVQAAPWISVSKVTLYLDGKEHRVWRVAPTDAVVRFRESIDVSATKDAYLVVRVDGDTPLAPVVGDRKRFTVFPFALTNPLYLDADNDGVWRPAFKHGTHAKPR